VLAVATLTVRRLDGDLYARLKERAQLHHRSLEAEARTILEASLRDDRAAVVRETEAFRAGVAARYRGDPQREIREGRER
jgi:plasmid stability protein